MKIHYSFRSPYHEDDEDRYFSSKEEFFKEMRYSIMKDVAEKLHDFEWEAGFKITIESNDYPCEVILVVTV